MKNFLLTLLLLTAACSPLPAIQPTVTLWPITTPVPTVTLTPIAPPTPPTSATSAVLIGPCNQITLEYPEGQATLLHPHRIQDQFVLNINGLDHYFNDHEGEEILPYVWIQQVGRDAVSLIFDSTRVSLGAYIAIECPDIFRQVPSHFELAHFPLQS